VFAIILGKCVLDFEKTTEVFKVWDAEREIELKELNFDLANCKIKHMALKRIQILTVGISHY
jgi:hypothetical protein